MAPEYDKQTLTAFALGEIEDRKFADDIQRHLANHADDRQYVQQVRRTGEILGEVLSAGPEPKLRDDQRDRVQSGAATGQSSPPPAPNWADKPARQTTPTRSGKSRTSPWVWIAVGLSSAAVLLVAASIVLPTLGRSRQLARRVVTGEHSQAYGVSYDVDAAPPSPERMPVSMPPDSDREPDPHLQREGYDRVVDNPFRRVADHPLSTFSIDVDTASYANVRRMLNEGRLPPAGAVRIEELVNYFDYDYLPPTDSDEHPFASHVAISRCPWNTKHKLVRIALKGREVEADQRPACNLVFLLDVSGSMNSPNKLPLVREAMKMLVEQLNVKDRVAIVVYAGAAGRVLDSTPGDRNADILAALDRLSAGGSTNGGEGIRLAYRTAGENFIQGGVNRVILCTDGDFNVGTTSRSELVRLIEANAKKGIDLSILGFGTGNYRDGTMEELSNKGNGNYAYVDTLSEARKVLVTDMTGTLVTIARDVKIQVEFNPANVAGYRLIGYENRVMAAEDFNDDTKDAGEIGAGHEVTALYEVVPAGVDVPTAGTVDALRYGAGTTQPTAPARTGSAQHEGEWLTLKLRYKQPESDTSTLMVTHVGPTRHGVDAMPRDMRFASAVAAWGMILRESPHKGSATLGYVLESAKASVGPDRHGYRQEFVNLVERTRQLKQADRQEGGGRERVRQ